MATEQKIDGKPQGKSPDENQKKSDSTLTSYMKSFGAGLATLSAAAVIGVIIIAGAPLTPLAAFGTVIMGGGVLAAGAAASKVKNLKRLPAIAGLATGLLISNSLVNNVMEQGTGGVPADLDKIPHATQEFQGAACKNASMERKYGSVEFTVPSGCTADKAAQGTYKPSGDSATVMKFNGMACKNAHLYDHDTYFSDASRIGVDIVIPQGCKPA